MAAATSKTDICNLALGQLGQTPVNDIEATALSTPGKIVASWYDNCRQQILTEHVWLFARKRKMINAEGVTPAFTWSNQFIIPPNVLMLLQVGEDDYPLLPNSQYVVEDNRILTGQDGPLAIKWIDDVEDVTKMIPTFKNALAMLVAAYSAMPILKSKEARAEAFQLYEMALANAGTINAIENVPKVVDRSRWRDAQIGLQLRTSPAGVF